MVQTPTRSRVEGWSSGHLRQAATGWQRQADLTEQLYGQARHAVDSAPWKQATRNEPFRSQTSADGCNASSDQLLAVGQKATFVANHTTTCVVGADGLTACSNGVHGFVLQPSGSWAF